MQIALPFLEKEKVERDEKTERKREEEERLREIERVRQTETHKERERERERERWGEDLVILLMAWSLVGPSGERKRWRNRTREN